VCTHKKIVEIETENKDKIKVKNNDICFYCFNCSKTWSLKQYKEYLKKNGNI